MRSKRLEDIRDNIEKIEHLAQQIKGTVRATIGLSNDEKEYVQTRLLQMAQRTGEIWTLIEDKLEEAPLEHNNSTPRS